ncbi:MAG: HAD-IB family hydrolase [Erysipelotrichaceae bacterium]|nr:HAD-IB family hydrolase [Erysipelotrichaceae bacterium]
MARIAAFFDIDGTIYREGLITETFKKFITYELVDQQKWFDEVRPAYMKWDHRVGEYDDYLMKMTRIYMDTIKNLSSIHIKHIAKRVIEQKGDRVYTFTRDEIARHKEAGHLVIAISGSPYELVSEMAKKHGFDDCMGTVYKVDEDGNYTGEIIPMWDSRSKLQAIETLCKRYDIDLSQSYAYGDTCGDFTMFEKVGHPYAMNPTRELLGKIKENEEVKNKIKIIVERKDVVYEMDVDHLKLR